jgi:hypothetical protein
VLAPRITKPSSQASQPHSRSQSLVPGGQTFEMWPGTAPESNWDWIPAMILLFCWCEYLVDWAWVTRENRLNVYECLWS